MFCASRNESIVNHVIKGNPGLDRSKSIKFQNVYVIFMFGNSNNIEIVFGVGYECCTNFRVMNWRLEKKDLSY